MQSLAAQIADLAPEERKAVYTTLTDQEAVALLHNWKFWARPEQLAPDGDWLVWLILSGRGWGKTRTGAEWVKQKISEGCRRIALIGETAADTRDVMVEGNSGLLSVYPEGERPLYEPSKRRVTWPNGAMATLYNATEPDQLRGPQHDAAWCDELAKWRYARETWDQLMFGMRLGKHPQTVVTTTPRPIELIRELVARANRDDGVKLTRGSTFDNADNLAAPALDEMKRRYEGTRLGRQELDGEILDDVPGALWTRRILDEWRRKEAPEELGRIVVAVDPAVTDNEESNEHGIVVVGMHGDNAVVLEDLSTSGSPDKWARRAVAAYNSWGADALVAEVNQGGDMVKRTLRTVDASVKIKEVRATRGKHVRAEPMAAMYEQGRVAHVGSFPEMEDQMTLMTTAGYEGEGSPDRVDALVWALTELFPSMTRRKANFDWSQKPRSSGWMAA